MPYQLDLVRTILRSFRSPSISDDYIGTDGRVLSPPNIAGYESDQVAAHIDRLVEIGQIERTREIRMRNHPDPVTLRATDAGRDWVRRAEDDSVWGASVDRLERMLSGGE